MMEAILVLPLHLVLLAGTIWIGLLATDRSRLAELDYAWAAEQTAASPLALTALTEKLYQEKDHISIADESPAQTADTGWWRISASRLKLTQGLPSILGNLNIFFTGKNEDGTPTEKFGDSVMASQGEPGGADAACRILVRNRTYSLDRAATQDWAAVAGEPFPDGTPAPVPAQAVGRYSRNTKFAEWSE